MITAARPEAGLAQGRHSSEELPVWLRPGFLSVFVLVLTVMRLLTAANSGLVEDEAYYRLWGLFPATGYFDHPPMVAWWIWLGHLLAGDTTLGLRVVGILSLTLATPFLWRTAALLFDRKVAGLSVLFLQATFLIGTGVVIMTPDTPAVLFWGLTLWALAELHASGRANWWLAAGLFAGLGLLSKYSSLFLGAGIVLWLLMPANRRWFGSWQLWAGGLIAVMVFLPVLQWNAAHEWASFYKQFGRAAQTHWTGRFVPEFILAFAGLLNPLIAIASMGGLWLLSRRIVRGDAAAGLLVLTCVPFVAYLFLHAMHSRVQGNWPAPIFPAYCVWAAVFVVTAANRFWNRFAVAAVALGFGLGLLVQLHAVSPLSGSLGRQDPTFQMRGWAEISKAVRAVAVAQSASYILTTSYGLNGQLSFALDGELPILQYNDRIRYVMMPQPSPTLFQGTGLYVVEDHRDNADWLEPLFGSVELVDTVPRQVEGTLLETMRIYRLVDPHGLPLEPIDPTQWKGAD
jgi:4-amino-4-deoxy-L-arabinose transferase-like glycosyltransferase